MFNCSSEGSGHPFEGLAPNGEVVCHIPELPLAPGRYAFNLYSTVGGEMADWVLMWPGENQRVKENQRENQRVRSTTVAQVGHPLP